MTDKEATIEGSKLLLSTLEMALKQDHRVPVRIEYFEQVSRKCDTLTYLLKGDKRPLQEKIEEAEKEIKRYVNRAKERASSGNALEVAVLYRQIAKWSGRLHVLYLEIDEEKK